MSSKIIAISNEMFEGCSNLMKFEIPENVSSIGYYVFDSVTSLDSIFIPSRVTKIWEYAFNNNPNLTIYCEANEKPADFDDTWNEGVKETKFGVTYEQYLELTSK